MRRAFRQKVVENQTSESDFPLQARSPEPDSNVQTVMPLTALLHTVIRCVACIFLTQHAVEGFTLQKSLACSRSV